MEENKEQSKEEVKEEALVEGETSDQVTNASEVEEQEPKESVDELKQRLENAKAENARKAQEIQRIKEELEFHSKTLRQPVFDPEDVSTWKDHELKAVMNNAQWAHKHDAAQEELTKRRFQRFQREEQEKSLRLNSELERQKNYPETYDPAHPVAIKMSELMYQHRLDNTPSGRLVAAKLARMELDAEKARAAGRKQEQSRQADVKANFQGESSRPAPKVSDRTKLDELKKKAMSGDPQAKAEWFKHKGLLG